MMRRLRAWNEQRRGRAQCRRGHHAWDRAIGDIDLETTFFQVVECERCGTQIDGVKAKILLEAAERSDGSSRVDARILELFG